MIPELQKHNSVPPIYLRHSDDMAATAQDFYDDLQFIETFPDMSNTERGHAIDRVLNVV